MNNHISSIAVWDHRMSEIRPDTRVDWQLGQDVPAMQQCDESRAGGVAIDRQLWETISRCVLTMVFYHDAVRSSEVARWVIEEIRVVVDLVNGWGIKSNEAYLSILGPVEDELVLRYGYEVGSRLAGKFIDEFESEFAVTATPVDPVASRSES
jgi:hypothetical protein